MALFLGFLGTPWVAAAKFATVTIDGAMVYKDANFDAPVIAYLKKGKRIRISRRTYGPFFKVRLRKGLIGYISDIDVKVIESSGRRRNPRKQNPEPESQDSQGQDQYQDESTPDGPDESLPIYAMRTFGLGLGMINYKDEVIQQSPSSNVIVYGLKATGPNLLFNGPFIFDINVNFTFSTPGFYQDLSDSGTSASGFLAIFDVNMLFPIVTGSQQNWMIYLGAGPLGVYSNYSITFSGTPLDLQEFKLGASFVGGAAYKMGRWALRLDGKFYWEETSYLGGILGIQRQF